MSVNGSNNFLNIEDANLRVRNGSVHAQGMTIGGAIVSASHGLQSVSDTGNTTSNTLQFTNPTTAFKATSNIELTANTAIVVESNVLMDFKTLGQIEFPGPLTLGQSLDVPRISRYDVDTETPRPEKLVVDFDTTVNSTPTDISGQGNHGAFYNGASYSPADKAFNFDGSQYIQGDTGLTGNFVHSISMWFNASNDGQLFWTGINSSSGDRLNIFFSEDGGYGGNTTTPQIHYTFKGHTHYVNVNPDQWYHLVCTYSGTNSSSRKIYIDGVPVGSDTATDGTGDTTHALNIQTSTFYLNKTNYGNSSLIGSISNFKLYNVALEPSEVKKLYNLGRTGRSMVISDTAVGIGKVPEAQLDVRGAIKGINMTSSPAAFSAAHTSSIASVSTVTTIIWNDIQYNVGGCYDNSTGNFTAPISGYYYFSFHMLTRYDNETTYVGYYINDTDPGTNAKYGVYESNQGSGSTSTSGNAHRHLSGSWLLYLSEGTKFKIVLRDGTSNGNLNRFTGFFVSS